MVPQEPPHQDTNVGSLLPLEPLTVKLAAIPKCPYSQNHVSIQLSGLLSLLPPGRASHCPLAVLTSLQACRQVILWPVDVPPCTSNPGARTGAGISQWDPAFLLCPVHWHMVLGARH